MTWDSQRDMYHKYRSMMHSPKTYDNYTEPSRYRPVDPQIDRPSSPLRQPSPDNLYRHAEPKLPENISERRSDWTERMELAKEKINNQVERKARDIALDTEIDMRTRERVTELTEQRKLELDEKERNEQERRDADKRRPPSELDYTEGTEGLF